MNARLRRPASSPGRSARRSSALIVPLVALVASAVAFAGPPDDAVLVKDINPSGSSRPGELVDHQGTLFFDADADLTGPGEELWRSDGTAAGTFQVKNIDPVPGQDSDPEELTSLGDLLLFRADNNGANDGVELFRSDGTEAGTDIVKDINPAGDSEPEHLTAFGDYVYFSANDGSSGRELWRSNGSEAGTNLLEINPTGASNPEFLTVSGEKLFFAADDGSNGRELLFISGSAAPNQIKNINSNPGTGSNPRELTDVNGTLFFVASDGSGAEVWKSDGTPGGTQIVKDINTTGSSDPEWLTNVEGTLYFSAKDDGGDKELWKSDGTAAGTVEVKDIIPGTTEGSFPNQLADVGGTLFFSAEDATFDRELWRSDGTEAGTVRIKDINPGGSSIDEINKTYDSELRFLGKALGDLFFFRADDGSHGTELWVSDGTEAGTRLFEDIYPGTDGSEPSWLTPVGGELFFNARDEFNNEELWKAVDSTPPETTIGSGPADGATISDPAPAFGFNSDDPPASFECRVDDGAFGACSGPGDAHTTAALADGAHTFEVRATDAAGNTDPTPAARGFTVDTATPEPPDNTAPALRIMGKKLVLNKKGVAKVRVRCPADEASGPCEIAKLVVKSRNKIQAASATDVAAKKKGKKKRRLTLAKAKNVTVAAGQVKKVKLEFSKKKRRLVNKRSAARKVKLIAKVSDQAGNNRKVTKKAKVTIKRGKKGRRK